MAEITTVKNVSPMLVTLDLEGTLLFYEDVLGFKPVMRSADYSIVERDGRLIHFQQAASEEVMKHVRGHTEIYVEVTDINPIWERVRNFRDRFKVRDLSERAYGMTEFQIQDPNGCLVFVGEVTKK